MSNANWENNAIQFPRLLAEIVATQDKLDIPALAESMDLSVDEVNELLDRAQDAWETIKNASAASAQPMVTIPQALWQSVQVALSNAHTDLNDASSVVDKSDDEDFAYQDTLELLKDTQNKIDAHEKGIRPHCRPV